PRRRHLAGLGAAAGPGRGGAPRGLTPHAETVSRGHGGTSRSPTPAGPCPEDTVRLRRNRPRSDGRSATLDGMGRAPEEEDATDELVTLLLADLGPALQWYR